MTKMRWTAFVVPLAIGLGSIVPLTGATHAAAATSGLSYHFGAPPIASAGSIGPGQAITFNLRVQNNGQPDPGGVAYISYFQGGHVPGDLTTVKCGSAQTTMTVGTTPISCAAGPGGVIPFTYRVPAQPPAQGRADWVAGPSPTSMVNSGVTHYVYSTVYRFSPSPLLSSGQVTLSAEDGLNHGIPQDTVYLSFKGTGSATATGRRLTATPTLFTTDSNGLLQIAYTAGTGDVITVQDLAHSATEINTDSSASSSTPVVSVGDVTVVEGDQLPGIPAQFTVTVSPVQSKPVTVQYVTLCGIGDKGCGEDFIQVGSPTTVTIPANTSSTTVLVRQFAYIGGNSGETYNEGYYVQVLNPSVGVVGRSIGNGMLLPDVENSSTALALLYTGSAGAMPTPGATVPLYFTVTLGAAVRNSVSFHYATSNSSAQAGVDYTAASGTATIASGQTSAVIEVFLLPNRAPASDKTFSFTISNAMGGPTIHGATGTGTLLAG